MRSDVTMANFIPMQIRNPLDELETQSLKLFFGP